ncbi:MAG: cell division protein FtsA [Spirochaetaceae bacterium]|nr:cell division protein FtsA [Spirochaetaceae bacterium]MDD6485555.1 cell division protein FtsA [Spirochaetales bacterium]
MNNKIVGLDIGTCNVRAVIAELAEDGSLSVAGVGEEPSTGLRKGVVINIEATLKAIKAAIEKAEFMAGCDPITDCYVAIGGSQIESFTSKGVVPVKEKANGSREIDQSDILKVIESARANWISMDREILHVIPQTYIVDHQSGVKDPRSMIGFRFETEALIVTASKTAKQNIEKCVERAGYNVADMILKSLAAARSVMTQEERNLGSILIDLGGGTTDVLVLYDDAPLCSCSIPVGGKMVTSDISIVKGISTETAEEIKIKAGCCWEPLLDSEEEVMLPGVGGRAPEIITRQELCEIIQPRVQEILEMVRDKLALLIKSKQLSGNIVLCGGGALMPGIVDLTSEVFNTSAVRIGNSAKMGGMLDEYHTPQYATATGIVLTEADIFRKAIESGEMQIRETRQRDNTLGKDLLSGLKEFFKSFF